MSFLAEVRILPPLGSLPSFILNFFHSDTVA